VSPNAPQELAYSGLGNPYLFTGRITDTYHADYTWNTDHFKRVQDNRNRMYDPEHGRWLQSDAGHYVDSSNLYEYARSCPPVFVDGSGYASYVIGLTAKGAYVHPRMRRRVTRTGFGLL